MLLVVAASSGCSAPPSRPVPCGEEATTTLKVTGGCAEDCSRLFAYFPVVQGDVMGSPSTPSVLAVQASANGLITVPLGELARKVRPFAKRFQARLPGARLSAQPAGLRIARVGTFFYDNNFEITSGGGFRDPANNDYFTLIYADRSGTVKGLLPVKDEQITAYTYDLDIPSAGLHWLRISQSDPTHAIVKVDDHPPALTMEVH
jgi:hypothetical protein